MVILFIAMRMTSQSRKDYELAANEVYNMAKRCFSYSEENNLLSLRLLQALVLIAMYELGNAIYPAAYLTVGHCARLGHAMGIHDRRKAPQMFSRPGKTHYINLSVITGS
jgi:hypothetical protein